MIDSKKIEESASQCLHGGMGSKDGFYLGVKFAIAELEPLQASRDHWRKLEMIAQDRIWKLEADLRVAVEELDRVSNAKRRTVIDIMPGGKAPKSVLMIEYDNERADEALATIRGEAT